MMVSKLVMRKASGIGCSSYERPEDVRWFQNGHIKARTHVACNLLAIDMQLEIRNGCDGLQHNFQHAEYFTCNPLITQPVFIRYPNSLEFYKLSSASSYNMM